MIQFTIWNPFKAFRDYRVTTNYLRKTGRLAVKLFKADMMAPKSGQLYIKRGGRRHRASAPGEFPANDEGLLRSTIDSTANRVETEVGTNTPYSKFLREGTGKMARRRMSDDALKLAIPLTRQELKGWVKWKR